ISKEKYFEEEEKIDKEGFFYNTIESIEEDTTLTRHKQTKALNLLENAGFIITKLKSVPAKRFYKLNHDKIVEFLKTEKDVTNKFVKNLQTGMSKINKQDCEKLTTNKNKTIRINNNKNKEYIPHSKNENFQVKEIENFWKEKGLPKYDYPPVENINLAIKTFSLVEIIKAIDIISQHDKMKNANIEGFFNKSKDFEQIRRSLNGYYKNFSVISDIKAEIKVEDEEKIKSEFGF
ncbi:MAG: hypothetical protein LBV03_00740, partial [Fusobacteriales bacterium]|nr:hypothetical protein [Fusobacteriales bacterium]